MSDHSVEIYYANGTIYRKYDEVVHENIDATIMDPIEIEQGTKSKQRTPWFFLFNFQSNI